MNDKAEKFQWQWPTIREFKAVPVMDSSGVHVEFNDSHTHAEVLEFLDQAISTI